MPRRTNPSDLANQCIPIPSDPFKESVYALIPAEYIAPIKPERYKSKFSQQAKVEYNLNRKPAASMGPLKVALDSPNCYLKKNSDIYKLVNDDGIKKAQKSTRKALDNKVIILKKSDSPKDYVKLNALENINANAKKPNAGPPSYLTKKDYGKTPDYLLKKMDAAAETKKKNQEDAINAEAAAKTHRDGLIQLPEVERLRILDGLKANWEKLNLDYQKLSLTVDTFPKISRKVNMEKQLKSLEEHIQKFSHTNVYVDFQSVYA